MKNKKFLAFSKMLSRRILMINVMTISVIALTVIVLVTIGQKNMITAYYQSALFASHESIEKKINQLDGDSLYGYINKLDVGINAFCPYFKNTNAKDDKEVWTYNVVIDSVGNYLYHPDKQRIGQGNFFDDIRQTPDNLRKELVIGLDTAIAGYQVVNINGVPSYIFYAGKKGARQLPSPIA